MYIYICIYLHVNMYVYMFTCMYMNISYVHIICLLKKLSSYYTFDKFTSWYHILY